MTSSGKMKKARRVQRAIHLHWMSDMSREEIADELDVSYRTVNRYLDEGPTAEEVNQVVQKAKRDTRMMAIRELKQQLLEVSSRKQSAKRPVKIYQQNGQIQTRDVRDDTGQTIDMEAVPVDVKMLPDEEVRYVSRKEIRSILDDLISLTGASEPQQHEVSIVDDWRESAND